MRLAQAQAREELRSFRTAGALMMVGVLGGLLSAFFLLFAIVAALSLLISVWVAALLVALVMAVVCAVLLRSGANLMRRRSALQTRKEISRIPMNPHCPRNKPRMGSNATCRSCEFGGDIQIAEIRVSSTVCSDPIRLPVEVGQQALLGPRSIHDEEIRQVRSERHASRPIRRARPHEVRNSLADRSLE
jgi:hypothetical protein